MGGHTIEDLTTETWPLFAEFFERQGGLFGGCWCVYFHPDPPWADPEVRDNRGMKQRLVEEGSSHSALVVEDGHAVAYAQYGVPAEVSNIHHRKQYDATKTADPDWRVTCIQVLKGHRREGLAEVALRGAVDLIAARGGGLVEGYPHDMALKEGKKTSSSFLYNGTRRMYERVGFTYDRPKGQFNCVMQRRVDAAVPVRQTPVVEVSTTSTSGG